MASSQVQLDNDELRITRWTLAPGADTGMHRHEYDYVIVPVAAGTMQVDHADGSRTVNELLPGVSYFRPQGSEHTVSGIDGGLDFVEIELKTGGKG